MTVMHNYAWHRLWTWRDRHTAGVIPQFLAFVGGSGLVSLAGNVGIVTTLTKLTSIAPVASSLIAIVVCGLVNYAAADLVVFKARRCAGAIQSTHVATQPMALSAGSSVGSYQIISLLGRVEIGAAHSRNWRNRTKAASISA
jgi:putative flippase GtrA